MSKEIRRIQSYRATSAPLVREVEGGHVIEGLAIVYGTVSVPLMEWGYDREMIAPGAVTPELLAAADVKMTMWHNRERLLARCTRGTGTLRLEARADGLWYSFDVPDTPDGQTALELVRRGDLAGASFTYWSSERNSVRYEDTEDGILRTVERIDALYELTLASDPAYPDTTAAAREEPEGLRAWKAEREAAAADELARLKTEREKEIAAIRRGAAWKSY